MKKKGSRTHKEKMKRSSSFEAISRDKYYKIKSIKHPPPPFGTYNINWIQKEVYHNHPFWKYDINRRKVEKDEVQPEFVGAPDPSKDDKGFIKFNL